MRKYFVLIISFFLYLCLGVNYGWSIFAQELKAHYGFSMTQAQAVFSIYQLVFPIAFFIGGRMMEKMGPIKSALAGSLLFGGGFILAGLLPFTSASLIFSIGVISGTGLGLAYGAPIYASQKNFPGKKSIATGITVAAFAISAVILSFVTEYLLKLGWKLPKIFLYYGIFFIITGSLSSLCLRTDEVLSADDKPAEKVNLRELASSKIYWALTIAMFSGLFAGLIVFSNIKSIGLQRGIAPAIAALGVPLIALFNTVGRISWGFIAHALTEKFSIKLALAAQFAVLILGAFFVRSSWTFVLFTAFAGFNYSSNLVLYASLTSKAWGVEALGRVYPIIFLCNAIAGFASPSFGGKISDIFGDYFWALIVGGITCIVGFIIFTKLLPTQKKRINELRAE